MKSGMIILSVILFGILLSGCSIAHKSWGVASSCDAFKVVIADPSSGNIVPEVIAGGGANAMLFALPYNSETEKIPSMFAYSRRKSMWAMFSSDAQATNVSVVYISGTDEKPEDTIRILEQMDKIVNPVSVEVGK